MTTPKKKAKDTDTGHGPRGRRRDLAPLLSQAVMYLAVLAVYVPLRSTPADNTMDGLDYHQLHARRIAFVQKAIGEGGSLPGWYPRELLGTPFRANIQDFPFIPTRLVLLVLDPLLLYPVAVNLSALLAAHFTYLYARRIGAGRVGAAAAGWTFAASGFYAARVMAGHLPLLEAYPALPMLLWLVEVCLSARPASGAAAAQEAPPRSVLTFPAAVVLLAIACGCVVLAGHPQIPFYSLLVAGLYLLWRGWAASRPRVFVAAAAMVLGAGCAAFSLWPMYLLIGRSTRLLNLDPSPNDVVFPYRRLAAFVAPWRDGWAPNVVGPTNLFHGYPNDAYFWETVCYVGLAPLLAVLALVGLASVGRRIPRGPWLFLTIAGVLALATALPAVQDVASKLPGTLLRSPSRQVYVTILAVALALGAAVDLLLRAPAKRAIGALLVTVALLAHFVDLWRHDRAFVRTISVPRQRDPRFEDQLRRAVGDGRVAIDYTLAPPFNREFDDVGFFDSIMLARPYTALLDLTGAPPTLNVQTADGSTLKPRALASTGVRLVITTHERPDLQLLSGDSPLHIYGVSGALPRVQFFPQDAVLHLDAPATHQRLRDPSHDLGKQEMLPAGASVPWAPATAPAATTASPPASVEYRREGSDRMVIDVQCDRAGVLRVLESWDPGWAATVNGAAAEPVVADDVYLGVPLGAGSHRVVLEYGTPGSTTGIVISLACVALLALLAGTIGRRV
jgi:hypothetical protein